MSRGKKWGYVSHVEVRPSKPEIANGLSSNICFRPSVAERRSYEAMPLYPTYYMSLILVAPHKK